VSMLFTVKKKKQSEKAARFNWNHRTWNTFFMGCFPKLQMKFVSWCGPIITFWALSH